MLSTTFYMIPASSNDADFESDVKEYLEEEYAQSVSYASFGNAENCSAGNYATAIETKEIGMNPNFVAGFMIIRDNELVWLVAVNTDEDKVIGAEKTTV